MPCASEAPQLLSAHPWTPPERLSQQTGTCSPTFPPTRNTQFPFSDSDKTTPLPRKSLLVSLNRKASLITSQSSPPTHHSHLHFLASLSPTWTRMEPCLWCWASASCVSPPAHTLLSSPRNRSGAEGFTQAHKAGHAKLRAPPGPQEWGGSQRLVIHLCSSGDYRNTSCFLQHFLTQVKCIAPVFWHQDWPGAG